MGKSAKKAETDLVRGVHAARGPRPSGRIWNGQKGQKKRNAVRQATLKVIRITHPNPSLTIFRSESKTSHGKDPERHKPHHVSENAPL